MRVMREGDILDQLRADEERLRLSGIGAAQRLLAPTHRWRTLGASGEPSLQNGWATQAGSPGFYRDAEEFVWLRGAIRGAGIDEATFTPVQVLTLPVTYRPSAVVWLNTGGYDEAINRECFGVVSVQPDGDVTAYLSVMDIWSTPGTVQRVTAGDTCEVWLDALAFRAV